MGKILSHYLITLKKALLDKSLFQRVLGCKLKKAGSQPALPGPNVLIRTV
jgi:hypothetical protein